MENNELQDFFKNIQRGLKKYSLEELNDSIGEIVTSPTDRLNDKKKKINAVLSVICGEFEISKESLLHGRGNGKIQDARRFAFCILHNDYCLTVRYIARSVFKLHWHTSVVTAVKYHRNLDVKLKQHRDFDERLKSIQAKIMTKIKNL